MRTALRVSKYDPALRLAGIPCSEWTSVSDIGHTFAAGVLTRDQYERVEDSYVVAASRLLEAAGITSLALCGLERASPDAPLPAFVVDGGWVQGAELERVIRLCLREQMWCWLEGTSGVYLHFGYDYYFYFGVHAPAFVLPEMPDGVFVEVCESPYREA